MPKGWRHWTVVLRALKRIGVDEYDRDDGYVYVTRFPHVGQAVAGDAARDLARGAVSVARAARVRAAWIRQR